MNQTLQHAYQWLQVPTNAILTLTYATAIAQALYARTGWRWVQVLQDILSALPGANVAKLVAMAGPDKRQEIPAPITETPPVVKVIKAEPIQATVVAEVPQPAPAVTVTPHAVSPGDQS